MVSIIKNQLLKHLSRFTKNLSADKINLSTFKGEGELSNLELNEIVLTDLLELPSWLRLTKAWCNKVTFRIPWTKLKSVPIHLSLDEVNITVETCEELRSMSAQGGLSSYAVPGKYSFIHKVIDGITVTVNTVNILFNSPAFTASVQLSRIVVESKSPKWAKSDLRLTRLKDGEKGQLLIFKELEWQTVRIEAKSTIDKNLTPLRLLTNQARCRIVIKKRLSDCFIMGSRLVIILDDLLWVLTDSQLKAALHFLDSLAGLVQKATQISRKAKAARKLEEFPEYQAQLAQEARSKGSAKPNIFTYYDVVETSYHFLSNQIVLHLCDDPGAGRSAHPNLKDGGALQIAVKRFQIDFYPYHLAKGNRKHWPKYNDTAVPHTIWQEQALQAFKTKFFDLIDRNKMQHTPLSRARKMRNESDGRVEFESGVPGRAYAPESPVDLRKPPSPSQKEMKQRIEFQLNKMMTTCVIMRIEDFTLYKVTTSGRKQALKEFIAAQHKRKDKNAPTGDRDHMTLPKDASIVHAEFIYYYYPSDIPFPLPPPKFYVHLNPVQIVFDVDSCLWLNSFGLNLYQSLMSSKQPTGASNYTYVDVKIEAILPRLNFESTIDYPNQRDRPKTLSFQVTRVNITNVRSLEQSSRADLAKCVDSFHMGSLFFGTDFPSQPADFYVVTQKFLDHISANDNIRSVPNELDVSSLEALVEQLSRELLWTEAKDVWCVNLDPVWGDFLGARAVGAAKPVPFLDAVPVTVWLHTHMDPNSTIKIEKNMANADIHALAHISNLVSVQLNHYQYLFLLRLAEDASEMVTFLSIDSNRILKVESSGSVAVGALLPQLEVTFVMPSQCPGKESSGGDVESFVPDSSSIADDVNVGSTATVWQTSTLSIHQDGAIRKNMANGSGQIELNRSYSMEFTQSSPEIKKSNQFANINIQNNVNAGLSSMKKGFANFMSSLDSALKPSPDDVSDTASIRSDASSDSENYVMISMETSDAAISDLMFNVKEFSLENTGPVEMASEVMEDESTITTTSDHSLTSSCRRKDLISVATFKLNKVEFLQQSMGYSSSIKVQVGNITCEDCSSIPWDEFQAKMKSKFNSRARAWTDNPTSNTTSPKVKLRLDHTLTLPSSKSMMQLDFRDRDNLKKLFRDLLTIKVSDLYLDLNMSTVTGLADLAEDEIIPIPIPMHISLDNVQVHLNEDRPPVNITSPGPIPIDLNVTQLYIMRSTDGVFNILPHKPNELSSSSSLASDQEQKLGRLTSDNEELRRRLAAFERVSEENRSLRKSEEETSVLRSCLASAQDEVARLLDEKNKLLEEVKQLKSQMANRQLSGKR
ncbi:bridge-like lipid transfer protein family member 3A isoform X1 [Tribolium castaneum]|uniref:bridge-like lipid transfer protein family member 3A isoform X1 n=1 Tax=Tribolium castaneum TaxID=7070 RepID=UPI00077DDC2B|nr:PREDICTED: UHRF1-binding protein 1 isoform X1 [Tribolium castaneum]|eukprot:XP_015834568.1 PREDICTED: UHRF1-binding protein 1 isoform X1 [Tribolium castaneum]